MSKALVINDQIFNQDWVGRICLEYVSGEYFLVIHSKHNDSVTQQFLLPHWGQKIPEQLNQDWNSIKGFIGNFFGNVGMKIIISNDTVHMDVYD